MTHVPGGTTHYFYFPSRSGAEAAAKALRAMGMSVDVRPAALGRDWLALARHPEGVQEAPDAQAEQFDALARQLGGEYDGSETELPT